MRTVKTDQTVLMPRLVLSFHRAHSHFVGFVMRRLKSTLQAGALSTIATHVGNRHDGELTFVGRVLAALPIDIKIGKLILLGHVFGLLDECLIIGKIVNLSPLLIVRTVLP